jgi:hypothetical protein
LISYFAAARQNELKVISLFNNIAVLDLPEALIHRARSRVSLPATRRASVKKAS